MKNQNVIKQTLTQPPHTHTHAHTHTHIHTHTHTHTHTHACTHAHRVNAIKLLSKKKWQPPNLYISHPFSELSPLSSKIFGTPQVTQLLEGPTPPLPHPFNKGEGVPAMYVLSDQV